MHKHLSRATTAALGRVADSLNHRYARVVGFMRHNQSAIDDDPACAAAYAFMDQVELEHSHAARIERFAIFERYVLERHAQSAYAAYLGRLRADSESHEQGEFHEKLAFMAPPEELVVAFIANLRKDSKGEVPPHKYEGIKALCGAITGTCLEFGSPSPCHCDQISDKLRVWEDADETNAAEAFDMAGDLPGLYAAVWNISHWNRLKQIKARRAAGEACRELCCYVLACTP